MVSIIYISNFTNILEEKHIETIIYQSNTEIKLKLELENLKITELMQNLDDDTILIINPKENKIKALEICKSINKANENKRVVVLLNDLSLEEANAFGFYKTHISKIENLKIIISEINFTKVPKKFETVIVFASLTESEKDSFTSILSFAKYLSLKNKKCLILEFSNSQLLNNSLDSMELESLYKNTHNKYNFSLESLNQIKGCDFIPRIISYEDKIKNQLNNSKNKTEADIEKELIATYINLYDYLLIDIGGDFLSLSSQYFLNISPNIFVVTNTQQKNQNDFYEIKEYFKKIYSINSIPIEKVIENEISQESVNLYKFLKTKDLKNNKKNQSKLLAEKIYKNLNLEKQGAELCLQK